MPFENPLTGYSAEIPEKKRRGLYRAKNKLDDDLRNWLKGKYLHERYSKFRDFFQNAKGYSPQKTEEIINHYKIHGIPGHIAGLLRDEIGRWLSEKRKKRFVERAKKAAAARWPKPKIAVKHPKTATKHTKTAGKHAKSAKKHVKPANKHFSK